MFSFCCLAGPSRAGTAASQGALTDAFPEIDRLFADFAKAAHVPGAAWGIVIDGELAHSGAAGVRDVAANAPVDADTVFRIASMTKSFTAMAILKLRDEGKLSLDDPAERYVPELKSLALSDDRLSPDHHPALLTHSEGFPEDNPWGDQQLAGSEEQFSRMLRGGIPFSNAPGIAYEYSNYGFAILGRIVSRVSGMPYDEYVARNILQPLGMTSTTLHPSRVPANRLAIGYRWEDDRWKEEPALPARLVRRDGRDADVDPRLEPLRRRAARRLAAARRSGDRTGPPRLAARDAAAWRPSGTRVVLRQVHERAAPVVPRATVRPRRHPDVRLRRRGRAQRRAARLRIADAVAARVRRRHHGVRQPDVHRLGPGRRARRWIDSSRRAGCGRARCSPRARSSTRAMRCRSSLPAGMTRLRTGSPRKTCSWIVRRIVAARSSTNLRATVGACSAPDAFDVVENALRGQWTMACERGKLEVSITLAPTMPPAVQYLSVRPAAAAPQRPATCTSF